MEIVELPKDRAFSIGAHPENDYVLSSSSTSHAQILIVPKEGLYFRISKRRKDDTDKLIKKAQPLQHKSSFAVANYHFTFLKTMYSCRLSIEKKDLIEDKKADLVAKLNCDAPKSRCRKSGERYNKSRTHHQSALILRATSSHYKQHSKKSAGTRKESLLSASISAGLNILLVAALLLFVKGEIKVSDEVHIILAPKIDGDIQEMIKLAPSEVVPATPMETSFSTPELNPVRIPDSSEISKTLFETIGTEEPTIDHEANMGDNPGLKGNLGKGTGVGSEFHKRVSSNNGRYDDVGMRVTLLWNDLDDLDLHVITPGGAEINFANRSNNLGVLDVDKNAKLPVRDPVENIYWESVPRGVYEVYVVLFSNKSNKEIIEFEVELNIHGRSYLYKSSISKRNLREPVKIVKFDYFNKKQYEILWRLQEEYKDNDAHEERVNMFDDETN